MNKLQNSIGNDLLDKEIFILENSRISQNKTSSFNISDIGNNISLDYMDLVLTINILSFNEKLIKDINCSINEIKGNNYTFECRLNENYAGKIESALSKNKDYMLLIDFDENPNNTFALNSHEAHKTRKTKINRYYFSKKFGGVNGCIIAAIVIVIIIILAIVIIIIIKTKIRKDNSKVEDSSKMKMFNQELNI